ncbi:MAG: hypothetical protein ABW131_05765 [Candidatus Sedimenticola sp. 6PFRAG5]
MYEEFDPKTLELRRGSWSEKIGPGDQDDDERAVFMVQWGDEYYMYFVDTEDEAIELWNEAELDPRGNDAHYHPLEYATISRAYVGKMLCVQQTGQMLKDMNLMIQQLSNGRL